MDDALRWRQPLGRDEPQEQPQTSGATARTGGSGDDQPVLIAVLEGPVAIGMARDALAEAQIPAYVKQNSLGPIYGLSIGTFGRGEVWVPPALADQAIDTLIGIGLLEPDA